MTEVVIKILQGNAATQTTLLQFLVVYVCQNYENRLVFYVITEDKVDPLFWNTLKHDVVAEKKDALKISGNRSHISQRFIRTSGWRHRVTATEKFFEVIQRRSILVRVSFAATLCTIFIVRTSFFVFPVFSFGLIRILQFTEQQAQLLHIVVAAVVVVSSVP